MRAMPSAAALAAIACVGACASMPPFPRSADEAVALVDAGPACSSTTDRPYESQIWPTRLQTCFAQFPQFLEARSIAGECMMRFDVDDAGVPVNATYVCRVAASPESDAQFLAVAKAAFQRASERALMMTRYAPADPASPDKRRTGLNMTSLFEFHRS